MNARISGLVVLASLVVLPHVYAQESPAQPGFQPRARRAPSADRPAQMAAGALVTLDIVLIDHKMGGEDKQRGDLPSAAELLELEKQGKLDRVLRVRLTSVEQNRATVQLGERVPVATARTAAGFGRGGAGEPRPTAYSYSLESLGTLIAATTRVEEEGTVVVEFQVERSRMAPTDRPPDDVPDAVGRQKTVSLTSQTTLRLKPGEPALSKASQTTLDGETTGEFIVVTASVDARGIERAAAGDREKQLRVYNLRAAKATDVASVIEQVFGDKGMRVTVDQRTNQIIAQGAADQLAAIQELLQVLDQPGKQADTR